MLHGKLAIMTPQNNGDWFPPESAARKVKTTLRGNPLSMTSKKVFTGSYAAT
jgi:hypothetical protein